MKKLLILLSVVFVATFGIAAINAIETGNVTIEIKGVQDKSGWEICAYKVLEDSTRTLSAVLTTDGSGTVTFQGIPVGTKVDFIPTQREGFIAVPVIEHVVTQASQNREISVYPIRNE